MQHPIVWALTLATPALFVFRLLFRGHAVSFRHHEISDEAPGWAFRNPANQAITFRWGRPVRARGLVFRPIG
jgi:hypothetical protein